MSLGLTRTKRRIASVKSTQKITKAMELVSTVKLKRFRDLVDNTSAYTSGLSEVMGELLYRDLETKTHYAKENDIILDTHVGSGSSLIACHNTNHKYVGFEIDDYYYEKAMERIERETAQMNIYDLLETRKDIR